MRTERRKLQSAGVVVLAGPPEDRRVALLHRPAPDGWRLPKGKLKAGETPEEAAVREVREETGLEVTAGPKVGEIAYTYREGEVLEVRKSVIFYAAELPAPVSLRPEPGTFDDARWMTVTEGLRALKWENERDILRRAAQR